MLHTATYTITKISLISVDGSLSDNSDEDDSSDKEERANRDGHPIGSGLSAATRMRFEKKRAQYVERQSAEQRFPPEEPLEYEQPEKLTPRSQFGMSYHILNLVFSYLVLSYLI